MSFGNKVKVLRKAKGMTQDELALAVGYTNRASISSIESGRADPACSVIPVFAKALGVSISTLLEEDPEEKEAAEIFRIIGCYMKADKKTQQIVKMLINYKEPETKK